MMVQVVSKADSAKFTCPYYQLYIRRGPNFTDPPSRIHEGISTNSSGHTTVESSMKPRRLPI